MVVTTNLNSYTKRVTENITEDTGNNRMKSNMFLRGYFDGWDQLSCLLKLKRLPWSLRIESLLENIFSIGINCMLLEMFWGRENMFSDCSGVGFGVRVI